MATDPNHKLHLADVQPRPAFLQSWERLRHRQAHWLVECIAEMFGVFFYCYAGVGATAPYVIGNILKAQNIGSLLSIGFAYALGVALAIIVSTPTSGGHFNPSVTIVHVLFKGYPVGKGARLIVAQILGAYLTCLIVYWQWRPLIKEAELALEAAGALATVNFTSAGPAGIFGLYRNPSVSLGASFITEFITDFFLGLVIWAALDPTNFFVSPVAVPWIIGFAYALAIWAFSPVGLAANTARDVGGRLVAVTIWGTAANGGTYAAIAALTNIPATILAFIVYEFIFTDSSRVLTNASKEFLSGHLAHQEHRNNVIAGPSGSSDLEEKGAEFHKEM